MSASKNFHSDSLSQLLEGPLRELKQAATDHNLTAVHDLLEQDPFLLYTKDSEGQSTLDFFKDAEDRTHLEFEAFVAMHRLINQARTLHGQPELSLLHTAIIIGSAEVAMNNRSPEGKIRPLITSQDNTSSIPLITRLLELGADKTATFQNKTAYEWAVEKNQTAIAELLLSPSSSSTSSSRSSTLFERHERTASAGPGQKPKDDDALSGPEK